MYTYACHDSFIYAASRMGWLRLVGSSKLQFSFAEYRLFYRALLHKRPMIPLLVASAHTEQLVHGGILQHTGAHCNTLQHTATHCNTLQNTATHCNTLQRTATHCNALQHSATHCNTLQHSATHFNTRVLGGILPLSRLHTATHCNTLQHIAIHCSTLQHTATHCIALQHTTKHCNTLQHTATHCYTLQHTSFRGHPSVEQRKDAPKHKCVAVCYSVLQCVAVNAP